VDDHIDAIHRFLDCVHVTNIAMNKRMTCSIDTIEVPRITGIGKRVQIGDLVIRMIGEPIPNKVRSDESGASGYEQVHMPAFFIKIDGLSKHDTVTGDLWPK
jgi:hypothetical protein